MNRQLIKSSSRRFAFSLHIRPQNLGLFCVQVPPSYALSLVVTTMSKWLSCLPCPLPERLRKIDVNYEHVKQSQTCLTAVRTGYSSVTQTYHLVMCVSAHSVVSNSLRPHGLKPARLLCPWNFPGRNTGVGCHSLLQGIFPTQGLNPRLGCLLHQQVDSLPLSHFSLIQNKCLLLQSSTVKATDSPHLLKMESCSLGSMTQQSPGFPSVSAPPFTLNARPK